MDNLLENFKLQKMFPKVSNSPICTYVRMYVYTYMNIYSSTYIYTHSEALNIYIYIYNIAYV